jgi:sulfonate transport system ATP-binding protein
MSMISAGFRGRTNDRELAPDHSETPVAVRLRRIEKSFGEHHVLRGIDLDIGHGQFVAIVGHSGSGKSTLLRLVAELDAPSGGQIEFANGIRSRGPVRLMFQEPRLLPWARVAQNIEIGLSRDVPAALRRQRTIEALRRVGLAERGGEWPSVLSGGQKQRVALARALVSGPWLLALDEPLGALDALTRIGMQDLIEEVWHAEGFTVVLVTHDVAEAVALADRVLVLEAGQIRGDFTIDLPRPRDRADPRSARLATSILNRLLDRPAPVPSGRDASDPVA